MTFAVIIKKWSFKTDETSWLERFPIPRENKIPGPGEIPSTDNITR